MRAQLARASPGRDYDLDCFVSSELGYNEVLLRCMAADPTPDGAYLGVGPDQSYTYVGALRPRVAIIADARLDNTIEHLVWKVLFQEARDPLDFLCLTFGHRRPRNPLRKSARGTELVARLREQAIDATGREKTAAHVLGVIRERWSANDFVLARAGRFLGELAERQLRITSVPRERLSKLEAIPDFEEVLSATTPEGFNLHYLTDLYRFGHVKMLHAEDRIVPLLGSVVDRRTIEEANAIAGCAFTAIYLSNLEDLILGRYVIDGAHGVISRPNPGGRLNEAYARMIENLRAIRAHDDAVLIRFFLPGTHRGRNAGIPPWLVPHVTFLSTFLDRCERERPTTVLATYL